MCQDAKKDIKDPIVDLKKKTNKAKLDKRKLLQAHEDEGTFLYTTFSNIMKTNILPIKMDTQPTIN